MNKQNIAKLKLFLDGIISRFDENELYLDKIQLTLKSGNKIYQCNINYRQHLFNISINGTSSSFRKNDFSESILSVVEAYDYMLLNYIERGMQMSIECDAKGVRLKKGEIVEQKSQVTHDLLKDSGREYLLQVGKADRLLKEIGIMGENGKIKNDMIRKYNQIDHFIELIHDILTGPLSGVDTINVLDCACGKSYLSFALNYYLKEVLKKNCFFIGIDYQQGVIDSSSDMAARLDYKNMLFQAEDLKNYVPDRPIHLVISLHACDTATDLALGIAVRLDAKAIIAVPCCHKELLSQYSLEDFNPILKHGILKARMADVLTEGVRGLLLERHGYKVSMLEYISPLDTPKNLMIKAVKQGNWNKNAANDFTKLKNMLNITPTLDFLLELNQNGN